jgi:hypothetical protein
MKKILGFFCLVVCSAIRLYADDPLDPVRQEWQATSILALNRLYLDSAGSDWLYADKDVSAAFDARLKEKHGRSTFDVKELSRIQFKNSVIVLHCVVLEKNKKDGGIIEMPLIYKLVKTKEGWRIANPPDEFSWGKLREIYENNLELRAKDVRP